ncbi:hypothetical protein GUITHDRAFT_101620 [Guillardia theta CCMP2712]|uniref:Tetraspanin n=1 Tax=Guillardia theta (strain CCMP2712) TaxID=905079 RepID=L1JVV1_GUITC|nr:hypothetical protein GUITHDRAFT_101620 [Guillardia theta CCMP2712]EKX52449.1 hypothetical protein GUITHDRAFT_101620 [Guillardia theta CCMP2712]|eukprot:XP_005839429.1 hypothetical protein GUITHDRAFT_101620 [Guillardia theta CCMP2712]
MANLCCEYKTSRRGLLVLNMLILLFSFIFIGVGAVSLTYANSFGTSVNDYCKSQCVKDPETAVVFASPAIGLVVVGVFTFFISILGCVGAIRERPMILYLYICLVLLMIILQIGFGAAAAAISSGNSAQIQGPVLGVLRDHYTEFDWKALDVLIPPACYEGQTTDNSNITYNIPLCSFDTGCVRTSTATAAQTSCCTGDYACDTSKSTCITGKECVMNFLNKAGAPVAVVCFLPIVLEIAAIVFACIIRTGRPTNFKSTV